jgi:hypothetical protein
MAVLVPVRVTNVYGRADEKESTRHICWDARDPREAHVGFGQHCLPHARDGDDQGADREGQMRQT